MRGRIAFATPFDFRQRLPQGSVGCGFDRIGSQDHPRSTARFDHVAVDALVELGIDTRCGRDAAASALLEYDNDGNLLRRHVTQQAHGAGTVLQQVTIDGVSRVVTRNLASLAGETQDLWYAYDDMNRQVMVEGAANGNTADTNNLTTAQGHLVTYDKNGNRTSDTFQGSQLVAQVGADGATRYLVHQGRITVHYRYDAAGRLSETAIGAIDAQGNALDPSRATVVSQNYYDAAGHLIQSGGGDKLPAGYAQTAANNPGAAFNTNRTVREYDADGRLQHERITDRAGVLVQDTSYAGGYDAVGNVLSYTITDGSGNVSRTTVTEIKGEGYDRSGITTTKTAPSGVSVSASTHYAYDVNGELVRTDTTSAMGTVSTIKQTNDFDGNILQTIDGNEAWNRLVVDGQVYAVWDPPTGDVPDPTDAITAMYWELLDRAPDAAGLAWWVHTVVDEGYSLQSVYDGIKDSDEYKQLHSGDGSGGGDPAPDPGPTAADLVTQAYQALLGRAPSSQELSYWTNAMAHGMSIFEVETQMQASPEYENRQVTSPDPGNFAPNGDLIVNYRPGDTLQGLALAAYGDASLAYLIAQANGITAGSQLASLKEVVIPKVNGLTSSTKTQTVSTGAGKPTQGVGQMQSAHADIGAGGTTYTTLGGGTPDARTATVLEIMNHVGWFQEDPSIPTIFYVQAYDVYKMIQGGANLREFVNKDYDSIVRRIVALNTGHPGHPADMVAPDVAPINGRDMSKEQFGESYHTSIRNSYGGVDQPSAPSSAVAYTGSLTQDHPSVPVLTAGDFGSLNVDTGLLTSLPAIDGQFGPGTSTPQPIGTGTFTTQPIGTGPSTPQPIYSTSSGTDRAPAQILVGTTPVAVSKEKSYDYQTVQTLANGTQQIIRVVHVSPDDKAINAVNDWLQSDHEFAVGGGIYAGVGFDAEATIQVNISKGEIGVSQAEVGLGIGAGGSLHGGAIHPEGTPNHPDGGGSLSTTLYEDGIGDKQKDHTIAISTKVGIEVSVPLFQGTADAKVGVQSQIGGGVNSTFMGANWGAKVLVPVTGIAVMGKWNVYNWSYKR